MAGSKIPLVFRIFKGDQLLREERLTQPVIKVGKLSSSHLRLDDESVSRMHAVIEVTGPGDISIIDLGSTKGTIVNGQKVNKARLQDGDLILLGDLRIEFSIGQEEASEPEDLPTKVTMQAAPTGPADSGVIASTPKPPPTVASPFGGSIGAAQMNAGSMGVAPPPGMRASASSPPPFAGASPMP